MKSPFIEAPNTFPQNNTADGAAAFGHDPASRRHSKRATRRRRRLPIPPDLGFPGSDRQRDQRAAPRGRSCGPLPHSAAPLFPDCFGGLAEQPRGPPVRRHGAQAAFPAQSDLTALRLSYGCCESCGRSFLVFASAARKLRIKFRANLAARWDIAAHSLTFHLDVFFLASVSVSPGPDFFIYAFPFDRAYSCKLPSVEGEEIRVDLSAAVHGPVKLRNVGARHRGGVGARPPHCLWEVGRAHFVFIRRVSLSVCSAPGPSSAPTGRDGLRPRTRYCGPRAQEGKLGSPRQQSLWEGV